MRSSFTKFSAALLVLVLSTGVLAASTFAMDREDPRRDRENPIVRVLKQLHFIVTTFDQISVPKP